MKLLKIEYLFILQSIIIIQSFIVMEHSRSPPAYTVLNSSDDERTPNLPTRALLAQYNKNTIVSTARTKRKKPADDSNVCTKRKKPTVVSTVRTERNKPDYESITQITGDEHVMGSLELKTHKRRLATRKMQRCSVGSFRKYVCECEGKCNVVPDATCTTYKDLVHMTLPSLRNIAKRSHLSPHGGTTALIKRIASFHGLEAEADCSESRWVRFYECSKTELRSILMDLKNTRGINVPRVSASVPELVTALCESSDEVVAAALELIPKKNCHG